MWCYMHSTLTNDKKTFRHCHKWLGWLGPSISSLAWVWWVITKKYGEHSSLLCENAILINMTDRAGISLGMRPANERRRYNIKTSLMGWAHTWTVPLDSEGEILWLTVGYKMAVLRDSWVLVGRLNYIICSTKLKETIKQTSSTTLYPLLGPCEMWQ